MKINLKLFSTFIFTLLLIGAKAQVKQKGSLDTSSAILPGAVHVKEYLPLLKGKTIAVVANQTSMIGNVHLVDSLVSLKIKIRCVLAPEHGFRGTASAGQKIKTGVDEKTGLLIVSIYGKHMKPTAEDLNGVDIVLFDIQDVGARFYTYISTLQYVMEACAEQNKELIVLDRPNPNGFYVDGPVLEKKFSSFVGMQSIPVVYGMTIGEYATMLNGENWLNGNVHCKLTVIKVKNYTHDDLYQLPVRPSPNLPDMAAVYLYPSLCFFEGTKVSVGRGTGMPFKIIGYPAFAEGDAAFIPKNIPGVAERPMYQNDTCSGLNLAEFGKQYPHHFKRLYLFWLLNMYKSFPQKEKFFTDFFEKLAGNERLQDQIESGMNEETIRNSWEKDLNAFKLIRKKYLLYDDYTTDTGDSMDGKKRE